MTRPFPTVLITHRTKKTSPKKCCRQNKGTFKNRFLWENKTLVVTCTIGWVGGNWVQCGWAMARTSSGAPSVCLMPEEKMCLKISRIVESFLQVDYWWPKTSGYPNMPGKASKPRRQHLDHFISQQQTLKSQGCGKSGVKLRLLSWQANYVHVYLCV